MKLTFASSLVWRFLKKRCQQLGVPLVVVTEAAAQSVRLPRSLFDELNDSGSPVGGRIYAAKREAMQTLWRSACSCSERLNAEDDTGNGNVGLDTSKLQAQHMPGAAADGAPGTPKMVPANTKVMAFAMDSLDKASHETTPFEQSRPEKTSAAVEELFSLERHDRHWFAETFCTPPIENDDDSQQDSKGAEDPSKPTRKRGAALLEGRGPNDSVWDAVETLSAHDPIALLACVPELRDRYYKPSIWHVVAPIAPAAVQSDKLQKNNTRKQIEHDRIAAALAPSDDTKTPNDQAEPELGIARALGLTSSAGGTPSGSPGTAGMSDSDKPSDTPPPKTVVVTDHFVIGGKTAADRAAKNVRQYAAEAVAASAAIAGADAEAKMGVTGGVLGLVVPFGSSLDADSVDDVTSAQADAALLVAERQHYEQLAQEAAAEAESGVHSHALGALIPDLLRAGISLGNTQTAPPLVIITDPGQDLDDEMALVLMRALQARGLVECIGVIANLGPSRARARLARGTLDQLGLGEVPRLHNTYFFRIRT